MGRRHDGITAMEELAVYLASLAGSWRALTVTDDDAHVVETDLLVASISPRHPVLSNAVVLHPEGVAHAVRLFANAGPHALWSRQADVADRIRDAGYRPDEVTYPMVLQLDQLEDHLATATVTSGVHPEVIAGLNSVSPELLVDVPGLRTYATSSLDSGAVLIEVGADVNLSFVATRPEARRRGLAAAVVATALRDARADGFRTSSLQATKLACGLYRRLGYRSLGSWQEWVND